MADCLARVAGTIAGPLLDGCRQKVLPIFENYIIYRLKMLGWIKDKHTILARDLVLYDPHDTHWGFSDPNETRFMEAAVAVLKHGTQSFDIKGVIKFDSFLPDKTYGVFLIFKITPGPGPNAVLTATVSTETDKSKDVCLTKNPKGHADQKLDDIKLPINSSYDGWMELELGKFECRNNPTKPVEEIIIEVKENSKHIMRAGVYVAGIELRSK